MSQVEKEIIIALSQIRNQVGNLQSGDKDALIPIGAGLEEIHGKIPESLTDVSEIMILCLYSLQAIFQQELKNFSELTQCLSVSLLAVEQSLNAPPNPISELMLTQAKNSLQKEFDKTTDEASDVEEKSLSLDAIATLLLQIDESDRKDLEKICESLKELTSAEVDKEKRKMLVKAAREITRVINGKAQNAAEALSTVGELVEKVKGEEQYEQELTEDFLIQTETNNEVNIEEAFPESVFEIEEEPEFIPSLIEEIQPKPLKIVENISQQSLEPDVLSKDADRSLVSEFVVESRELLEAAESSLLALETEPDDLENVNTVFRAFHTIKGTAAYLGLTRLTDVAHHAESLLSRMRDREIRCTGGYADLALRSLDMLKEMLNSVEESVAGNSMKLPYQYADLMNVLRNPEGHGISAESENQSEISESKETDSLDTNTENRDMPENIGEILISLRKITEVQMRAAIAKSGEHLLVKTLVEEGFVSTDDITEALETHKKMRAKKPTPTDSSVRVRTDRLDRLIDMVGELVIAQSMLAQDATVVHGGHHELSRKISHAGKIVRELQDLSMGMRMVPLKTTFQKMARLVRDVSQKCGKSVEFVSEGEDTEIDRNMVDFIADPLVHMVRNAVDHGIEMPDVRETKGKHRTGHIKLAAYHAGGDVVVELADNGAGLDRDKIVAKAISKNLIESDKGMSENEIFQLVFAPGFSTADQVTDLSGRGVGMDVVRRNIEAMRGRIEITSEKGKGSTFTIRLPLTLAITDGMLVRIGTEKFIVPTINIQLSFQPNQNMLSTVAGKGELVSLRGELMPIFRLHELFDVKNAVEKPTEGLLMIVADGRRRCALLVDELLGQQQVVAKTLGQGVGKIHGVSGGAILGDGCVGLILDTTEIVALARQNTNSVDRKEDLIQLAA